MKRLVNGVFLNTRHTPSKLAAMFSFVFAAIMLVLGANTISRPGSGGIAFLIIASVFIAVGIVALMYNYDAYLKISGTHISARFAWRKRLECDIADVADIVWYTDVENPHTNRLVLLMRSGRTYTVRYLANADAIGAYLSELLNSSPNEPS